MIDAHHHLLDPSRRHYPWLTADEAAINRPRTAEHLEPLLGANGVTATVLVQTVHTREESIELLGAAADHRWIAGVVGWVDLTASNVPAQLTDLRRARGGHALVGIRHNLHDETDARWILRPEVLKGLGAIAAAGLTFDLLVRPRELPAARAAVRELPELQFVLDHAGKPPIASGQLDVWRDELARLAAAPNVACKLSGLVTEAAWGTWAIADLRPAVNHVRTCFGAARLLFGSDWPVCELAASYEQVVESAQTLSPGADWAAISHSNARRVYALDVAGGGDAMPSGLSEPTADTPL